MRFAFSGLSFLLFFFFFIQPSSHLAGRHAVDGGRAGGGRRDQDGHEDGAHGECCGESRRDGERGGAGEWRQEEKEG